MRKIRNKKGFVVFIIIIGFIMSVCGGITPQSTQKKYHRLTPSNTLEPNTEYANILAVDHKTSITVNRTLTIKIRYEYPDGSSFSYINQVLDINSRTLILSIWRPYGGGTQMAVQDTLDFETSLPILGEWTINVNDFEPTTVIVKERKIGLLIGLISVSILVGIAVPLSIIWIKRKSK